MIIKKDCLSKSCGVYACLPDIAPRKLSLDIFFKKVYLNILSTETVTFYITHLFLLRPTLLILTRSGTIELM